MCGSAETPPGRRLSQLGDRARRAAMERRPYQTDEQVSGLGSHVRAHRSTLRRRRSHARYVTYSNM